MKKTLLFLTTFASIWTASAQNVTPTKSVEQIRKERARVSENAHVNKTPQQRSTSTLTVGTFTNILQQLPNYLFGSCVTVSNLTYTGNAQAIGYFSESSGEIASDFTGGVILSTGNVLNAPGPNNGSNGSGTDHSGSSNDVDLDSIADQYFPDMTGGLHDHAKIEFDFTSIADTISTSFVFASDEYESFVGDDYNDVFAFFISGPGISGTENLATVPDTTLPITINSINANLNSQYYVDLAPNSPLLQADGRTVVLNIKRAITPGATYHFKIIIADGEDGAFDSQVFLNAASFSGLNPVAQFTSNDSTSLTVDFTNNSTGSDTYAWDFGDSTVVDSTVSPSHTYDSTGTYTVTLIASNVCYSDTTTSTVTITSSTVGIQSINASNAIKLMPTSTEGIFNASIVSSVKENVNVLVYDVRGQLVVNELNKQVNAGKNNFTLNLSNVANGLYTVQIIGANQAFVGKLIK